MIYLILSIAKQVGVSGLLVLSVCTVETGLKNVNNYADGHGGSFGICQLNERTAKSINPVVDRLALMQPQVNVQIAAIHLKNLYSKYNNVYHTAAAYNAGLAIIEDGNYRNKNYMDKFSKTLYNYSRIIK